jgi:hypothetical protein
VLPERFRTVLDNRPQLKGRLTGCRLRALRPAADPLLNFAESLTPKLADFGVAEALGDLRKPHGRAWRKAARGPDGRPTPEGLGILQAAREAERELERTKARTIAAENNLADAEHRPL